MNDLVLNFTYIVKVDPDFEELIPTFMANRQKDYLVLSDALQNQDWLKLQSIGHTIKGTSGGYGFDELGIIGEKIEHFAKQKEQAESEKWIKEFKKYLELVKLVK